MKYRLAIVETHPIQYKAPLFRLLASHPQIDPIVLYAMIPDAAQQGAGFGIPFTWDVPLLEGYRYEVLENRAKHPAANRFGGCDTPGIFGRLRQMKPDAVLVNGWVTKTCLQALWACRRLGIPCFVRGEANLLRPRATWKHGLHRLLMRQYSAYFAIGSANRAFYRFHHCPEDRIFFAPYAVDNEFFAVQAAERAGRREAIRESFGIPPGACVFLFAGKLVSKKHPSDLLEAIALLPGDVRGRVHVLMAGTGPLRDECEQVARERGISAVFAGFLNQSRLPDAYVAADALVLPSDAGETWGLVVNEAMASGLPAVVSDQVGCHTDLIVQGETGLVFTCGNVQELSRCLGSMVDDSNRRRQMGEAARTRVAAFSNKAVVQAIMNALDSMGRSL